MNAPLLDLKKVALHLKGIEHAILLPLSYTLQKGDFVIVIGSNGSGKSSLLKLIDKRYTASNGEILLEGKPLRSYAPKVLHHKIKTLTQNTEESLFETLTVFENYLVVKQQYEPNLFSLIEKKERAYFENYVESFNPQLSRKLDQAVRQLSGGEKQALALALTVLYPPRLLLLDEHTSALDPKSAERIMALTRKVIEEYQITCLLTTHNLAVAKEYGNRILALKEGKLHHVIESAEKAVLTELELLQMCY